MNTKSKTRRSKARPSIYTRMILGVSEGKHGISGPCFAAPECTRLLYGNSTVLILCRWLLN